MLSGAHGSYVTDASARKGHPVSALAEDSMLRRFSCLLFSDNILTDGTSRVF